MAMRRPGCGRPRVPGWAGEEGLAEIGLVSSLFDPAKLAPQNVTYFTPFVQSDATFTAELMDRLQAEDATMRAAWEEAYLSTPHGAPVTLRG